MEIGTNVRIKNHPTHTGEYGVVIMRYRKGKLIKYTVSVGLDDKAVCFPYQLVMIASNDERLCTWDDVQAEVDWKPDNTTVEPIGE